jgi:glycosyltransferase involved in cell wall biosynthesis
MPVSVAFVYANPRHRLLEDVATGAAPDTGLLGLNHLAALGVDASLVEPRIRRSNRLSWHARELFLPLDLRAYDVVCTPLANYLPRLLELVRGPGSVVLNYGLGAILDRGSRGRRRILLASLRASGSIVCFSRSQRERLLAEGLDPGRVEFVPLGVDDRFFSPSEVPTGGPIVAVGRDLARDYGTFARAVAGLERRSVIVASERNLRNVALPDGVEVRRDVPYDELRRLYAAASCVVVPTHGDEYPYGADCSGQTVLLDAMASARPVVVTRRDYVEDYVEDGLAALVVPPGDADALRNAIVGVLEDPRLASRLALTARRDVEQRFTTRSFAERLAPILRSAAGA